MTQEDRVLTPEEALLSPTLIADLIATSPAVRCLAFSMIVELDRRRAAARNPTLAAMMQAVPDQLMRDIVNDSRRGVAPPSSLAAKPDAPQAKRGTGWQEHHAFPDRTKDFELMDAIVASQVGGPNNVRRY
jgi:hypothetical protein